MPETAPLLPARGDRADRRRHHQARRAGGRRPGRRRARRLDHRRRRAQRLSRAVDLGGRRRAAHRRHDLLCRDVPRHRPPAGLRAVAVAGRRRHTDRRRADGGRPRRHARLRHARPHDADRLLAPHRRRVGKDRAGRRPRLVGEGARGGRSCVEALHRLRHGEDRRRRRLDDLGQPARRAGRFRRAAVFARKLRAQRSPPRGRGIKASLTAFAGAFERARGDARAPAATPAPASAGSTGAGTAQGERAGSACCSGWQQLAGARRCLSGAAARHGRGAA